mmetsp:Transcript_6607/g.17198  ORF Transcript_6607/g.17198 Transcript_6607/m.17198 type:complete len:217 (+) Transcript_6607:151-801(+)
MLKKPQNTDAHSEPVKLLSESGNGTSVSTMMVSRTNPIADRTLSGSVISSWHSRSFPRCRKMITSPQNSNSGEFPTIALIACSDSATDPRRCAVSRPNTAVTMRPPSSRPTGIRLSALQSSPVTPTTVSGCSEMVACLRSPAGTKNFARLPMRMEALKMEVGTCGHTAPSMGIPDMERPTMSAAMLRVVPTRGPEAATSKRSARFLGKERMGVMEP